MRTVASGLQVEQAVRQVDGDHTRYVIDDEHHRDELAALEDQEVVRGIRFDGRDPSDHGAAAVTHLRADQLVDPELTRRRVRQ